MTEKYLERVDRTTRESYLALEDKRVVDKLFQRHETMSAKCGLGPDPSFLVELFAEINADRLDFITEGFGVEIC